MVDPYTGLTVSDPNALLNVDPHLVSTFPGNSLGTTIIPSYPDSSNSVTVGFGSAVSTFESWASDLAGFVSNPGATVKSGWDVVENAASDAKGVVSNAVNAATSAAVGFSTWTKYVAYGLIAIAAIYFLSTVKGIAHV